MLEERLQCVTAVEPKEQRKQMKTKLQATSAEVAGLSTRKKKKKKKKEEKKKKKTTTTTTTTTTTPPKKKAKTNNNNKTNKQQDWFEEAGKGIQELPRFPGGNRNIVGYKTQAFGFFC